VVRGNPSIAHGVNLTVTRTPTTAVNAPERGSYTTRTTPAATRRANSAKGKECGGALHDRHYFI